MLLFFIFQLGQEAENFPDRYRNQAMEMFMYFANTYVIHQDINGNLRDPLFPHTEWNSFAVFIRKIYAIIFFAVLFFIHRRC